MLNIAPTTIFPLRYPKTDLSLPAHGAKAVPVSFYFLNDNQCTINLVDIQQQKDFESLRCVWIDTTQCAQPITVDVSGTGQRFLVQPNTSGYYPVIVLNNPLIMFEVNNIANDFVKVIFLNFIPHYSMQPIQGGSSGGHVIVDNFPLKANFVASTRWSSTGVPTQNVIINTDGCKEINSVSINVINATSVLNATSLTLYDVNNAIIFDSRSLPCPSSAPVSYDLKYSDLSIIANGQYSYIIGSQLTGGIIMFAITARK